MEGAKCPYCQAAYKEEDGKCAECKALFPWAIEVKEIREDIKSREVNRGRATFTLIDELFAQAKGGKPVSLAALKGFAFAWLFPRTLIVIGSVITGLVLIVQTFIIYRQTELLGKQTAAAQLEQAEKLRSRITANADLSNRLFELSAIRFNAAADFEADWKSQLNTAYIRERVEIARSGKTRVGWDEAFGSLGHTLIAIDAALSKYNAPMVPTGYDAGAALRQAQIRCALPKSAVDQADRVLSILRPLSREHTREWPTEMYAFYVLETLSTIAQYDASNSGAEVKRFEQLQPGRDQILQKLGVLQSELSLSLAAGGTKCAEKIKQDNITVEELERKATS